MELKLFSFIEDVLQALQDLKPRLEVISEEIEGFFEDLLAATDRGYININTRVKTQKSLKEKIIRNHYYQKYETKEALFENVPDIIGVRLECRFIEDETDIYKFLKKYFNEKNELYEGYFSHNSNQNIILKMCDKQPQEQKNGMKIFRIDGKYLSADGNVNFEIQIKSLVNIFWSEIEHKVIYKNYNYVIADRFYKDIMKSIKNSLTTIDQQLLLISNQFNETEEESYEAQEKHLEAVLSKFIYDIFAKKMKESIGVLVDFRKSCEAIVRYVFRDALGNNIDTYDKNLVVGFEKVRKINQDAIDFRESIKFEKQPVFKEHYESIIGNHIIEGINDEFQWNLFFRILFAIEPENNVGDFESFVSYYMETLYSRLSTTKLNANFTKEETKLITDTVMLQYADLFTQINSVELFYEPIRLQVIKHINGVIDTIYRNVLTYEQWEKEKDIYLDYLEIRLFMMFNLDVDSDKVLTFLDRIRATKSNIEVPKGMVKYIYSL